jgi:hypothetical protein
LSRGRTNGLILREDALKEPSDLANLYLRIGIPTAGLMIRLKMPGGNGARRRAILDAT